MVFQGTKQWTTGSPGRQKNKLRIFCCGACLMFSIYRLDNYLVKFASLEHFPLLYFDVSQFYIMNILIQKFERETQNFIHIWNYKLTFKICLMKLSLIQTEKLLLRNLMHERKSKNFVYSAKCSIYWTGSQACSHISYTRLLGMIDV